MVERAHEIASAMTATEPLALRWKRRVVTIPAMLGATAAGLAGLPFVIAGAAATDSFCRRVHFPSVRVSVFLTQYAVNDSIEILLAPVYWLLAGFGTRLDAPASVRRHERLQSWSIALMAHRAEQLLGLRLDIDRDAVAALTPGPVIVMCNHVNMVDASFPAVLYTRLGYRTRGVLMAELLADPGFDLLYQRTGSVFIPRDNGPEAKPLIARLADGARSDDAIVIFPEGRVFRPERLQRSLARLVTESPERATRLAGIRHTLPPRPGGFLALLDALPCADVVVIAHAGLDRYQSLRELARSVPLRDPIRLTAWRAPAAEIPTENDRRIAWLDDQWCRVDNWIESQSRMDARVTRVW
jgi:1-acyl-sn-glycerol-3-phosphate acyltransferase